MGLEPPSTASAAAPTANRIAQGSDRIRPSSKAGREKRLDWSELQSPPLRQGRAGRSLVGRQRLHVFLSCVHGSLRRFKARSSSTTVSCTSSSSYSSATSTSRSSTRAPATPSAGLPSAPSKRNGRNDTTRSGSTNPEPCGDEARDRSRRLSGMRKARRRPARHGLLRRPRAPAQDDQDRARQRFEVVELPPFRTWGLFWVKDGSGGLV